MSTNDPIPESSSHCGDDAAAYVLGALERVEAEAFRQHLISCVVCRDEVTAFQQVADALPLTAPGYKVPRSLRRRVLRDVRAEPKLGPAAARGRRRTILSRAGLHLPLPRPALALAALLAALVLTVGALELVPGGSSGVRVIQASLGSAELRVSGNHGELIVNHLPPPPAGRIYEVWLQRGQRKLLPTSALFSVTSRGTGDVDVPGDLDGVSEVLVSPEPAGGSLVPTHPPVIIARLT